MESLEVDDLEERLVSALNLALSMLPPADAEDAHAFQPGDRVAIVVGSSAAAAAPPPALEEACATLGRQGVSLVIVSSLSDVLDESPTASVFALAPRASTRRPDGYFSEYIRCALAHGGRLAGPFVMTTKDGKPCPQPLSTKRDYHPCIVVQVGFFWTRTRFRICSPRTPAPEATPTRALPSCRRPRVSA